MLQNIKVTFKDANQNESGFTLVELLVVLAIIGAIAALATPSVLRYLGSAKVIATKAQMKNISNALELYYVDSGVYPSGELGLDALIKRPAQIENWNGPYLKKEQAIKDSWGNKIEYLLGTEVVSFKLKSLGRDGKVGGEGLDSDLVF